MAPPPFALRVRCSRRIAQKSRTRPLLEEIEPDRANNVHQEKNCGHQRNASTVKPSRRQQLKENYPEKYELNRKSDAIRSAIYRLEMTDEERIRSNTLAAIRQKKYRERVKAKKEAEQTNRAVQRRRLTRSEAESKELQRKKAREKKQRQRRQFSENKKAEINAKRRDAYKLKKLRASTSVILPSTTKASSTIHSMCNASAESFISEGSSPVPVPVMNSGSPNTHVLSPKAIVTPNPPDTDGLPATSMGPSPQVSASKSTPRKPKTSSGSARRKRLSRIRPFLPNNPDKFVELLQDMQNINSPSKLAALERAGLKVIGEQKRRLLEKEVTDIVSKHVKGREKTSLTSALNSLKTKRLQRYASKILRINRKQIVKRSLKKRGRPSVPQVTIAAVHNFFEDMAQPMPDKKLVSKKTGKAKMWLNRPVSQLYTQFMAANPETKLCRSNFFKLKPNHIRSLRRARYRGCLCEQCENIRLKIVALDSRLQADMKLKDGQTTLNMTLCPKPEDAPFHKLACIKRSCKDCGISKLDDHFKQIPSQQLAQPISWRKWDLVAMQAEQKKVKRQLVMKHGTMKDLIEELKQVIGVHALHIFNWRWQAKQFKYIKENLPDNWVLNVWDFAENYTCFFQDEAQSAYWTRNQVTIHPVVTYYKCERCEEQVCESIVFVSDDNKHDHDAVHTYMEMVAIHLNQKRNLLVAMMVRFSDGCAGQYKSKGPIADIAHSSEDFLFPTHHNYYGSRHGKGPSDGESAVIKSHASTAVKSGSAVIAGARDLYNYCVEHLHKDSTPGKCTHFRRSFYFIDSVKRGRERTQIKTVKGTRSLHSILTSSNVDEIKTRTLSCFCEPCVTGTGECVNSAYVSDWNIQALTRDTRKAPIPDTNTDGDQDTFESDDNNDDHTDDDDNNDADISETDKTGEHIETDYDDTVDSDGTDGHVTDESDSDADSTNGDHLVETGTAVDYTVGDYVVVIYDDVWFPGEILGDLCRISFMKRNGNNKFQWPSKKDEVELLKSGIFTRLPCAPAPVSQRYLGFDDVLSQSITDRVAKYLSENKR